MEFIMLFKDTVKANPSAIARLRLSGQTQVKGIVLQPLRYYKHVVNGLSLRYVSAIAAGCSAAGEPCATVVRGRLKTAPCDVGASRPRCWAIQAALCLNSRVNSSGA